jgi:hypothetical protein
MNFMKYAMDCLDEDMMDKAGRASKEIQLEISEMIVNKFKQNIHPDDVKLYINELILSKVGK